MQFPAFEDWYRDVIHPDDTHPWNFRTAAFYEEYRTKYAIAKLVQPRSILEIGVRFGYGARSFLMASPGASYVGLDVDEPSWGPYPGIPRVWAEAMLRARHPDSSVTTHSIDTQRQVGIAHLHLAPADLVHIDADHSFVGCSRDLHTFWPLAERVMVVDDYSMDDVKRAVDAFVTAHAEIVSLHITSLRGSAILMRETS